MLVAIAVLFGLIALAAGFVAFAQLLQRNWKALSIWAGVSGVSLVSALIAGAASTGIPTDSTSGGSSSTTSDTGGGSEQRTIAGPFTPGCYQDVNAWYEYFNAKKLGLDASVSDDAVRYPLQEGDTVTVLETQSIDDHPGLETVTGDLVRVRLNQGLDAGHTCWLLEKLDLSMPGNGEPFK